MKRLEDTFYESFGMQIPSEMLPKYELLPVDVKPMGLLLYGSSLALEEPWLLQGGFVENCPEGYFLIGFWGHGVNSYAFHYSLVDSWRKIFFRLPYGGVYMDNERNAKYVRKFLINYLDFERELIGKTKTLVTTESMWSGHYRIEMLDGNTDECRGSLFEKSDFKERFSSLFS